MKKWDVEDLCAVIGTVAISLMGVLFVVMFMIYMLSSIR